MRVVRTSAACSRISARIRDALKTQLRVLVAMGLLCAIWLVVYFAAFSPATRNNFKNVVAPLNTDWGVWLGALIQAVFSVLTPFVLGTDDDLPQRGCGSVCLCTKKEEPQDSNMAQDSKEEPFGMDKLEEHLDDVDASPAADDPNEMTHNQVQQTNRNPSFTNVVLFLVWKTVAFTIILAILTYYVRWFYNLQDKMFGTVIDEQTDKVNWDVLFKKIAVDEYLFTPTNIPPVVTLFLFTRLLGRHFFLQLGPEEEDGTDRVGEFDALTCNTIALSWLVWIVPHYILCLLTWFPSHLMIYPMPSGVQLPLFMCVVVVSNVLQSYMTMSSGGQDGEVEKETFSEWASVKAGRWFG
jgi:hypothetical protein